MIGALAQRPRRLLERWRPAPAAAPAPAAPPRSRWGGRRWGATQRMLSVMDRLHVLDLLLLGRRVLPRRSLIVLNYHRILDEDGGLDQGVVSATAAEFSREMALLARVATPIGEEDLRAVLAGRRALPDNAVMVTFDDGYRDNYELALPILQRHGVPATFFVTTGYIETGRLPWWDRLSYVLQATAARRLRLRYPVELALDLGDEAGRRRGRRSLLHLLKHTFQLDHERFFAELEGAARVHVNEAALARGLFMSWREIAALRDAGMGIGSHTHRHRPLETLGHEAARRELTLSAALLREGLGAAPRAIAYPVGRRLSPGSGLRELVQQAGYDLGFTFVPGLIQLDQGAAPDRLNLPRLPVDGADHRALLRCKTLLAAPSMLL